MFNKKSGLLFSVLLISSTCHAQSVAGFGSLKSVFSHVLRTNPAILEAHANEKSAYQSVNIASANYFPNLQLSYGYGFDRGKSTVDGVEEEQQQTMNSATSQSMGATVTQLLFDGGKSVFDISGAKRNFEKYEFDTDQIINQKAFETAQVYLDIIKGRQLIALSRDNVAKHQATLAKMQKRFEQGAGRKSELELAKGRLAQAQFSYYQNQSALMTSQTQFTKLTGLIAKKMRRPASLASAMPRSLHLALSQVNTSSPKILSAERYLQKTKYDIKAIRGSGFFPSVSIVASASKDKNLAATRGETTDYSAMAYVGYNLFNGGADLARVRKAIQLNAAAAENMMKTHREVVQAVTATWYDIQATKKQISALTQHVSAAANVVNYYKQEFKLGKRSLLNVLDVENELFTAKTALLSSRYQLATDRYRLLSAMGILPHYMK